MMIICSGAICRIFAKFNFRLLVGSSSIFTHTLSHHQDVNAFHFLYFSMLPIIRVDAHFTRGNNHDKYYNYNYNYNFADVMKRNGEKQIWFGTLRIIYAAVNTWRWVQIKITNSIFLNCSRACISLMCNEEIHCFPVKSEREKTRWFLNLSRDEFNCSFALE